MRGGRLSILSALIISLMTLGVLGRADASTVTARFASPTDNSATNNPFVTIRVDIIQGASKVRGVKLFLHQDGQPQRGNNPDWQATLAPHLAVPRQGPPVTRLRG